MEFDVEAQREIAEGDAIGQDQRQIEQIALPGATEKGTAAGLAQPSGTRTLSEPSSGLS